MIKSKLIYDIKGRDGTYSGFVVNERAQFILVQEIRDFYDEGFSFLVKKFFSKKMAKKNSRLLYAGLNLNRINKRDPKQKVNDLKSALEQFVGKREMPLINYRDRSGENSFVGLIVRVEADTVVGRFLRLDGTFGEPERIGFGKIRSVHWDNRYLKTMQKLVSRKPNC